VNDVHCPQIDHQQATTCFGVALRKLVVETKPRKRFILARS
jgi:hypothetical protein